MLTSQLQGTLTLERQDGTTFTLRFAELHYQERS
jgi:two-component sensor histidine kinase